MLVRGEAVVGAGLDENGTSLPDWDLLTFDLQDPGALEHDVDLVVLVRLLPVGLGCNEDVDAELEACGFVHDLVASAGLREPLPCSGDLERTHVPTLLQVHGQVQDEVLAFVLMCGFPVAPLRPDADAGTAQSPDLLTMSGTGYAVWWQEGDAPRHAGKLLLGRLHLLLSGNGSGRLAVALDEIVGVDYRRGELEIKRRTGPIVRVGNLDGPGVLLELSDALAAAA
jgi:hypothetical protein